MEYKAFKDLTKEERSEIVEAKLRGEAEWFDGSKWEGAGKFRLNFNAVYRIKPAKKLDIPWEIIKPEYKWAAMDEDGHVCFYKGKPLQYTSDGIWDNGSGYCHSPINIDTTGISWENSLTQRPEGI